MAATSALLPRLELADKLLQAIAAHPLTVVAAPTGYGKTTLARALAEAAGVRAYYYTVPAGPHDARFIWHDLSLQFAAQGLDIAPVLRRFGFPESASQSRQAINQLRGLGSPAFLILDDYHLVTDPALDSFWESVVRTEIPGMHLVLFSRVRPDMHLEELCIKGLAAVFGQELLAFSEAETRELFRLGGISDDSAASEAHTYSEGWPAAAWLCLQNRLNGGRAAPLSDIESLLANTVFAAYDEAERDFLLRLSVLEHFNERDANKLSGLPRSQARLRTLRAKNAFLCYDTKTGQYRFHALFRDFLRKELAAAPQFDRSSLYRLAAECCLERKQIKDAFFLLARAGRDQDLSRFLDLFLEYEHDGECLFFYREIFKFTRSIPWRVRLLNPLGYLAAVAAFMSVWHDASTAALLEEAEEHFLAARELPEYLRKRIQGECLAIRGMLAFNDMERIWSFYEKAASLLDGPSCILGMDTLWNYGSPVLSFICLREQGGFQDFVQNAERGSSHYLKLSGGIGKEGDKIARAEYLLERGEFPAAEPLLWAASRGCGSNRDRQAATEVAIAFNLARLFMATARAAEAPPLLERLRSRIDRLGVIELFECLDLAVGYISAQLGNFENIPEWLRAGDMFDPPHSAQPQLLGFSLTVHGRALLLQGDYHRLAAVATDLAAGSIPFKSLFARLHGTILKALAAWHTHGLAAGTEFLREALDLARSDGIVLALAEYGAHIVPLLRRLKRMIPPDEHLCRVLALAERSALVGAKNPPDRQKAGLTPRELEFMRYVLEGKTNPAIAEGLGLSREAVKKALGRAYAKLGASGRFEAAQRFAEIYGDKGHSAP